MKREEILKLIEEKEAKDLVFKTRGEEKAKRTEEIFHIIKQDVMDKVVKHCVECGYSIDPYVIRYFTLACMLENKDLPVNHNTCKIERFHGTSTLRPKNSISSEDFNTYFNFVNSFDTLLLLSNVERLMERHGFYRDSKRGWGIEYTTTKEKLLSFSEIISNDVYQPKTVKTIKNPLYDSYVRDAKLVTNMEKDNTLTYQVLGVIVFFIILFIWKFCF